MTVAIDTPGIDAIASGSRARDCLEEVSRRAELLMRPYVPVREGILRSSALVSSDFAAGMLSWSTPYAARHYYVPMAHTDPAGMATDHWDEAMMAERGDELTEYAAEVYGKDL